MATDLEYFGIPPAEQREVEYRTRIPATANQTTFPAPYQVAYVDVFRNGAKLDPATEFTGTDGQNIILATGASAGDIIEIISKRQVQNSDIYSKNDVNNLLGTFYGIATGTSDAIVVTANPAPTNLNDGMEVKVRMGSANTTTTPTLNVNGLGAVTVVGNNQTTLSTGAWQANSEVTFRYSASSATWTCMTVTSLSSRNSSVTVSVTTGSVVLSASQYMANTLVVTGSLTGNVSLVFPNNGWWNVQNLTTGGYVVSATTASGTSVNLASGVNYVFTNGGNAYYVTNSSVTAGFKNYIINGNFDFWQRALSTTTNGYCADRWRNAATGTTFAVGQQSFVLGQTAVPNEPAYFHRTVVTSVAGAGNFYNVSQYVEGVRTLAGGLMTFSFWAKADAARPIALEFLQGFGTGGSPSAAVQAISVTKFNLTTTWQKFSVTTFVPSIAGKTLGTNGDDNFVACFWFDAGSNFNSRTLSLGQQSGTFDIAQVQLEAGPVATAFEKRSQQIELALCQRYYEKSFTSASPADAVGVGANGLITLGQPGGPSVNMTVGPFNFKVTKRIVPTVVLYNPLDASKQLLASGSGNVNWSSTTISNSTPAGFSVTGTSPAGSVSGTTTVFHYTADADF